MKAQTNFDAGVTSSVVNSHFVACTVDFTSGGLRDILMSIEGLYDQTLSYGLGLISVRTVKRRNLLKLAGYGALIL